MLKKLLLLLLFILFCRVSNSQPPSWAWAKSACSLSAATSITSITVDAAGNVFIAGNFRDSARFGNTVFHPTGTVNLFLAKYDSSGNFLWMRHARGANIPPYNVITDICTDNAGNCYITGSFNGTSIFDHDTITSLGSNPDVFIAKYTPSGSIAWLRKGDGTAIESAYGIGLDADGNCYVGGSFQIGVAFGTFQLGANNASNDVFIVKLDTLGNFISLHGAGGSGGDQVTTMSVDAAGNCYIAGFFNSPDIIFGPDTIYFSNTSADAFIAKFDSAGNALWGNSGTGPANQEPAAIASDQHGNCFVTGVFKGDTMHMNTTTLVTYGYWDFFTATYDAAGDLSWAGNQGSANFGTELSTGIATDSSGNFYTAGKFLNPATFPPLTATSTSAGDVFITKFNSTGAAEWVQNSGTSSNTLTANAFHRDDIGNMYITGVYEQNTTFGNDSLVIIPGYTGGYYIAKLGTANTTAIQNVQQPVHAVEIFPNPVSDKLHVRTTGNESTILVFDITGKNIYKENFGSMQVLDVKYFTPGMYLLEITTDGEVFRKKFIRQ